MEKVINYLKTNEQSFVDAWVDLLKIPSISADPAYQAEIEKGAKWCENRLNSLGLENVAVRQTVGCPVVYGDWLHAGADKPTVLIYGHYDVQPPDPIEGWTTPPFEPTIRDGKMYARGACDDKGQMLTHLMALEAHMKTNGKLPINVKVFIEGEEEAGTGATDKWVEQNQAKLACDAAVISDTAWHNENVPSICYGLRGICYIEVRVKGPNRDLHSGVYGGMLQNPLNAVAKIIAKLQDDDGVITIPAYHDDITPTSAQDREEFKTFNDDEGLKAAVGVKELWGEKGYSSEERNWIRPSLDVNGIWGGYAGDGPKTVIPSEAGFKLSSRIVPGQSSEKCFAQIKQYIESVCPPGVSLEIENLHGGEPLMVPTDNLFLQAALSAYENGFACKPHLVRHGASIPITAVFASALGAASIFVGFGLNSDNIHSPNEKFNMDHFHKGILTNVYLYEEFAKIKV
jgi:acetylornithine deacetylase/succinyl-diaminopimelate desuccinylase-like protein